MKYYECKPVVTAVPDEAGPICVAFAGTKLMLTIVDASWLAENIQRAIRDLHRGEVERAVPLTVEQRRTLKVGDVVLVRMDHGHPVGDDFYTVRQEPWQLGHGAWVIGLDGISGGYDLSRVLAIRSTTSSRGPTGATP